MNQQYPPAQGQPAPPYPGPGGGAAVRPGQPAGGVARKTPVVTYTLIGLSIAVFLLQMASQYLMNGQDVPALYGMKINQMILRGQYWRFFTPMLLHGSILHIGFNMYALYMFGPGLERHYGRFRFLLLYLVGGFAGNVLSFLFSSSPSLGSSTAIFGLLGAEGVFLYRNRQLFGDSARRALGNIITIGVINLMIGLAPGSNIDNWGHLGGLLGGSLFAWAAGPLLRLEGVYPYFNVTDEREPGDVARATLLVGGLFAVAAALAIVLRAG